jgi:uncharacterized protein YbjT (DUF2867 family)
MPTALLAGATGLVGRECLRLMLDDPSFTRIVVIARRPHGDDISSRRLDWRVVDFTGLDAHHSLFKVDDVICALGTTMKQAGSKARFREVDHGYALAMARLGVAAGASQYLLVSALGADATSRFFYNRVKGETERDIRALPYQSVTIVRPSMLLGNRAEFRLGERIAQRLGFLMPGGLKPIHASSVASALVASAKDKRPGQRVISSAEMRTRFERGR